MGVMDWLFPKEEKFFDLLKNQAEIVEETSKAFKIYINQYNKSSPKERIALVKKIKKLEHVGDKAIRNVVFQLNNSFITPIDREDIHSLTNLLDDIIDNLDMITRIMVYYRVEKTDDYIKHLTEIIYKGMGEINLMMTHLRKFKDMRHHCEKVNELEHEGDMVKHQAISALFSKQKDAIELIKYKEIYEQLEAITDKINRMAIIIEGLVVKHA